MENLSRKWAKTLSATGYFLKVPTKTSRVEPVWYWKKKVRTHSQNQRVLPLAEVLHRPTYIRVCCEQITSTITSKNKLCANQLATVECHEKLCIRQRCLLFTMLLAKFSILPFTVNSVFESKFYFVNCRWKVLWRSNLGGSLAVEDGPGSISANKWSFEKRQEGGEDK